MPDDDVVYQGDLRVTITQEQLSHWEVEGEQGASDLTAYGPCPVCEHDCIVQLPLEIVPDAAAAVDAPSPERATRKFPCTCTSRHPRRPAKVVGGCGRWFLAAVEPGDGGWRLSVNTDESVLAALTAMEEAVSNEVSRVRTSAEKWLPGIAALYGLFGLAGVVVGKDTIGSLQRDGKWLVAILVLVGLGCTVAAIWFGYKAAFGWPTVVGVDTDAKLKDWYAKRREAVLKAPGLLRISVGAAVAALTCLLLAVFVIWFWPAAQPPIPKIAVTYQPANTSGTATTCGELQTLTGTALTLSVSSASGTRPQTFPLAEIQKIKPVAKCPS